MKPTSWSCGGSFLIVLFVFAHPGRADVAPGQRQPIVFQCDPSAIVSARQAWLDHDPAYAKPLAEFIRNAQSLISDGPYTIVRKQRTLPGVDPHDYVSLAPYYWPNPNTADGLPYIRRDGERNPQYRDYDAPLFGDMGHHVQQLALAGFITGERRYSDRAALLIRAWFFDPATRMNPNLQHAQFVEGVNDGRGTGILESDRLLDVIDGIGLLDASGASSWSAADRADFNAWLAQYRMWMQSSEHGKQEAAAENNHGSWYAVQLSAFSLFLNDPETARRTAESAKARIGWQIMPDGEQPLELVRTKSFGYSTFNLNALTLLANLGRRVGVNLWEYKTKDGRCMRAALDYLIPYATGKKRWEHQQLGEFSGAGLYIPLRRAALAYHDPHYDDVASSLRGDKDELLFPPTYPAR